MQSKVCVRVCVRVEEYDTEGETLPFVTHFCCVSQEGMDHGSLEHLLQKRKMSKQGQAADHHWLSRDNTRNVMMANNSMIKYISSTSKLQ